MAKLKFEQEGNLAKLITYTTGIECEFFIMDTEMMDYVEPLFPFAPFVEGNKYMKMEHDFKTIIVDIDSMSVQKIFKTANEISKNFDLIAHTITAIA